MSRTQRLDIGSIERECDPVARQKKRNGQRRERMILERQVSEVVRSRNALPITDTLLKLIAAAAIMGLNSRPKNG